MLTPGVPVVITSPGYPFSYCDSTDCRSKIRVNRSETSEDQNYSLRIHFSDIQLLKNDFFHVYGGTANSSERLISFSDNEDELSLSPDPPGNDHKFLEYFTVSNEYAEIQLLTDSNEVSRGFNISVTAVSTSKDCQCPGASTITKTTNMEGSLALQVNESCEFLDCIICIQKPHREHSHLLDLHVESDFTSRQWQSYTSDEFFVVEKPKVDEGCGITIKEFGTSLVLGHHNRRTSLKSRDNSGRRIWYHFASSSHNDPVIMTQSINTGLRRRPVFSHRDYEISYGADEKFLPPKTNYSDARIWTPGLNITYQWNEECSCGERNFTAESDRLQSWTSPFYPHNYCDNLYCRYTITTKPGHVILFEIEELRLEANNDYLILFDGPSTDNSRLMHATGTMTDEFESSTNEVLAIFKTDHSINDRGFYIRYKSENRSGVDAASGAITKGQKMLILAMCALMMIALITAASYKKRLLCFSAPHRRLHNELSIDFSSLADNAAQP